MSRDENRCDVVNPRVPEYHLKLAASHMPFHTVVLRVHIPGNREVWNRQRRMAGSEAHLEVPSAQPRRV